MGRQRSLEQQDVLIAGSSLVSRRVTMELWKLGAGAGCAGGSLMTKGLPHPAKHPWLYSAWKGEHFKGVKCGI